MTPETTADCLEGLRTASDQVARPPELGDLEITVTPRGRLTPEKAAAFAEAGVHRLVPMPGPSIDDVRATIASAVTAIAGL